MTGRDEIRADVAAVQRVAEQEKAREAADAERRRAAREMDEAERIRADYDQLVSDAFPKWAGGINELSSAHPHYARVERVRDVELRLQQEVQTRHTLSRYIGERIGGQAATGARHERDINRAGWQIDRLRRRVVEAYIASGCSLAASVAIGAYLFFTR